MNQRPGIDESCTPDVGAVARDERHDARAGHAGARQQRALRGGHREAEEEVPVRRQEARGLLAAERREAGQQVADEQVAGRLAAHVQLVALVQALRRELEDLDRALAVDQPAHERAEVVAEEAQALDRLVGVGAEPQRLAGALVERREGARARRLVLDDPHRHRRRADAGHRADVVVLVAGRQADLALLDHRAGAVAVVAPSPRTGWPRRARGAGDRRAGAARSAGRSG